MTERRGKWTSIVRPVVRWVWALALFALGCWFVTPMMFHYWAAGGPPSKWPQWHEAWGNLFGAAVFACWAAAGLGVWFLRPRRKSIAGAEKP